MRKRNLLSGLNPAPEPGNDMEYAYANGMVSRPFPGWVIVDSYIYQNVLTRMHAETFSVDDYAKEVHGYFYCDDAHSVTWHYSRQFHQPEGGTGGWLGVKRYIGRGISFYLKDTPQVNALIDAFEGVLRSTSLP